MSKNNKLTRQVNNSNLGHSDKYQYAVKNLHKYQFCYIEIFDDSNTIVREDYAVSQLGNVTGFLQGYFELCNSKTMTCRITGLVIRGAFNNLNIERMEILYQGGLNEWLDYSHEGKRYSVECYDRSEGNLVSVDCFSDFYNAHTEYVFRIETGMDVLLMDYEKHICLCSSNYAKNKNNEVCSTETDTEVALQNAIKKIETTVGYGGVDDFTVKFAYEVTAEDDDNITYCVYLDGQIKEMTENVGEIILLTKLVDIATMFTLTLPVHTFQCYKGELCCSYHNDSDSEEIITEMKGLEVYLGMEKQKVTI